MPSALDRKVVRKEHVDMVPRFLVVLGAALMTIGSLTGITIVATGVSFVQAGTIFVTYAAGWLIPTTIAFIPAPFLLCYKSQGMTDFMLAYVAIALLFAIYELASIIYVGTRPGITDQTTILQNVFGLLANEINTIGAIFALACLLRLRTSEKRAPDVYEWPRLAIVARMFAFFWAVLMSGASIVGLAFIASGGSITFASSGTVFVTYAAGWLIPTAIAFLLTPLLLLYLNEGVHDIMIVYSIFASLFAMFNLASAIYVTVGAAQTSLLLNIVTIIINAINTLASWLFIGFLVYLRIRIRRPPALGEYEMTDVQPPPSGDDRTIFERKVK